MATTEIKIYDIMACNVYWDFEPSRMPKETHKMLVALYPTPGVKAPDMIESIKAYGPNGYEVTFRNEKYDNNLLNGWFYTPELQNYWWMVNLPDGFLKEGEYIVKAKEHLPSEEINNIWREKYGSNYTAGNSLLSLSAPRLEIHIHPPVRDEEEESINLFGFFIYGVCIFLLFVIVGYLINWLVNRERGKEEI